MIHDLVNGDYDDEYDDFDDDSGTNHLAFFVLLVFKD
jgi:hypothetical protein